MQFINREKKRQSTLTYIIITPDAMHEGDVLSAPKTPQIIATRKKNKRMINQVCLFLSNNLRMPVTIATIRTSQRNQNVVPSAFGC